MMKRKESGFSKISECAEQIVRDIAVCLSGAIDGRGRASLAVSGGRTPEHIFPKLARKSFPWHLAAITLADERWVDTSPRNLRVEP